MNTFYSGTNARDCLTASCRREGRDISERSIGNDETSPFELPFDNVKRKSVDKNLFERLSYAFHEQIDVMRVYNENRTRVVE
jgi:hypothetical protein